jgi:chaperonin cofactor prefoldin
MSIASTPSIDLDALDQELETLELMIEDALEAAWQAHGYVHPDGSRNEAAMHQAAYEAVVQKVATDKKNYHKDPTQSITRGELYKAVWAHGPEAGKPLNRVEQAVHDKLNRDVWSLTAPSPNGKLQQRLEEEGSTLVLCRSALTRGLDKVKDGLFVTDVGDLMVTHNLKKELDALARKAESVRKRVDMLESRHPELESAINGQLSSTLGRVRAALPAGDGN